MAVAFLGELPAGPVDVLQAVPGSGGLVTMFGHSADDATTRPDVGAVLPERR
jgi:hypothetical protein